MKKRDVGKGSGNRRLWEIAGILFLIAAVACMAAACAGRFGEEQAGEEYRRLSEQTVEIEDTEDREMEMPSAVSSEPPEEVPEEPDPLKALEEMGVPIPDKQVDFVDLQENVNEDIYAWLYIPDTVIDYPVLQHPSDNGFYLHHNLDGSAGYPGCIYSEDYNGKDFEDPVTVLYGHNMRNGTMFADLHKFEDSEFFPEHPYIYVYTPEGLLVYQIFAASEFSNEHLLYTYDFTDPAVFEYYIEKIKDVRSMNHIIDEEVEVDRDSHVLTLSTCVRNKPDNRFLVQGVLLNGD